jgi:hypothetical protein
MAGEAVSGATTQVPGAQEPDGAGVADALNGDAAGEAAVLAALEGADSGDHSVDAGGEEAGGEEAGGDEATGEAEKAEGGEPEGGETLPEGLKPEAKAAIQERMNKLTRLRREAEERAEAVEARVREAEERATTAEARLAARGTADAATQAGVPRVLLAESEAEIAEREAVLERNVDALEDWLEGHGPEDEFEEDGKAYSFAQVKAARRSMQRELSRSIPAARLALAKRIEARTQAERLYPDVLKKGAPDAVEAERLLAAAPGLRLLPDWPVWVGRMLAGKRLERKAESGERKAPAAAAEGAPPRAPVVKPAPRARVPAGDGADAFDAEKVRKSGYSDDVMAAELAKVI